jgi:hypothetical protein
VAEFEALAQQYAAVLAELPMLEELWARAAAFNPLRDPLSMSAAAPPQTQQQQLNLLLGMDSGGVAADSLTLASAATSLSSATGARLGLGRRTGLGRAGLWKTVVARRRR